MKEQNRKILYCLMQDCHINSGHQNDLLKSLISAIKKHDKKQTSLSLNKMTTEVDRDRCTVKQSFSHFSVVNFGGGEDFGGSSTILQCLLVCLVLYCIAAHGTCVVIEECFLCAPDVSI